MHDLSMCAPPVVVADERHVEVPADAKAHRNVMPSQYVHVEVARDTIRTVRWS